MRAEVEAVRRAVLEEFEARMVADSSGEAWYIEVGVGGMVATAAAEDGTWGEVAVT